MSGFIFEEYLIFPILTMAGLKFELAIKVMVTKYYFFADNIISAAKALWYGTM
jgi:hypothetical protein